MCARGATSGLMGSVGVKSFSAKSFGELNFGGGGLSGLGLVEGDFNGLDGRASTSETLDFFLRFGT